MEVTSYHLRHIAIFLFDSGKSAKTAAEKISAVYPGTMAVRTCQEWFAKFRRGDRDLKDQPRSGRPLTTDKNRLGALMEEDPCRTRQGLAEELGCA